ncbi:MAG: hypothetical protein OXN81_21815 [Alphaproteobacteria bacterium]|nr:hypothetical protein [Alphaproteobacteria bacterium]
MACSENYENVSGVQCIEPSDSDRDIDIRQDGATIATEDGSDHGIHGWKQGGTGDLDIEVKDSTVTTTGALSHGVYGHHDGAGSIGIDLRDSTFTTDDGHGIYASDSDGIANDNDVNIAIDIRDSDITTGSSENHGVFGSVEEGAGNVRIDLRNTEVETAGSLAAGVRGLFGQSATGKLSIAVSGGSSVSTSGDGAPGIEGLHSGAGDIDIDVVGSTVTTTGGEGTGNSIPHGVYGHHDGEGDIDIDITGKSTVEVSTGHGVFGRHESSGDIRLRVGNSTVTGTGDTGTSLLGVGIFGWHSGTGDIVADVAGSTVQGAGGFGYGIFGRHQGTGDIALRVGASTVTGSGEYGHGIFGRHESSGDIGIAVSGGSKVSTSGDYARGVYGQHEGSGDINIAISSGSSVSTSGDSAEGVVGWHSNLGDINIGLQSGTVAAAEGRGVAAYHNHGDGTSAGDIDIDIADSTVTAKFHGVYGYHTGTGNIGIDVAGSTVSTSDAGGYGVFGWHQNSGDIGLRVRDSKITTSGNNGRGVFASHFETDGNSSGDIDIDIIGSTITTTGGSNAYGVYGYHNGWDGGIDISVTGGSSVSTSGASVHAIYARHLGTADSDIAVTVADSTVTTSGASARGIYARRHSAGTGDIDIAVRGSTVTATDEGIYALHQGESDGAVRIHVRDSDIGTSGDNARGVMAWQHRGSGGIAIAVEGSRITTLGSRSHGVYAEVGTGADQGGDIAVTVRDSDINTSDIGSHGIMAWQRPGGGDIDIAVRDSDITTSGSGSHGIWAEALDGNIAVDIRNASVRASGPDSHGVRLKAGGTQTVSVNSEVQGGSGTGAGIWLIGGRVTVGPHGRVGAESGVAVRATRADPDDQTESPRLHVDLALNGRRVERVLQGRVENNHGTTALTVNDVLLFDDGEGGATGLWALNGIWDVTAAGTDLPTLAFTQEIAPRAAVYEALPGVLLRLDERGGAGAGRPGAPETPFWLRLSAGRGSYRPEKATVGARYRFDRRAVEAGADFPLSYGLTGRVGLRTVSGSARVRSQTGGGRIEASGFGLTAGLAWEGAGQLYAAGRISLTRYGMDFSSDTLGKLKTGANASVRAMDLEGGRRFDLGGTTKLTARAWLHRSDVSMDRIADAAGSRISLDGSYRVRAGAGAVVETGLLPEDGVDRLTLRGSLGVDRSLDRESTVRVLGTRLESTAPANRLLLGIGGTWRWGGFSLDAALRADGLGSDDSALSGHLEFRVRF